MTERERQSAIGRGTRVLLIDDDATLCTALKRALERVEYQVDVAHRGQQAVQMLNAGYDVIVSDIEMPDMSGIDVLRAVRQVNLDVPVVFITGSPRVDTAIDAVNLGALKYLRKPLCVEEVLETLREAADVSKLTKIRRQADQIVGRETGRAMDVAGLEAQFDRAMATLWMAHQPILSVRNSRVVAYEALLRFDEPGVPHVSGLLDVAERLGRVSELTARVCQCCAVTAQCLPNDTKLFINLHPEDLQAEFLFSDNNPLVAFADRVVFELTERATLNHVPNLERRLDLLREWGFQLAVDDLGAGYAGLSCFSRLRPEVVKIDMELTRDVHTDEGKRQIVGSLLNVCASRGVTVVMEGVEQPGERDVLVELGADLMQGYLFARPGKGFPNVRAGAFLRGAG